jgi:uncharacterized membrane-anchored protein
MTLNIPSICIDIKQKNIIIVCSYDSLLNALEEIEKAISMIKGEIP